MSSPVVAVAGASGFVGSWLLRGLGGSFDLIGLSRSLRASSYESRVSWRQADLFSMPKLTEAMKGADAAVYLVHSMLPSSRLVQGNFADLDLLLADNFVRAAEQAGVKHIIYLGGLIPDDDGSLSEHLASRKEVEEVLRSRSVEVTVLRSGLIYGRGGSSIRILLQLVRRLPIMVLPRWTRQLTQSTDVRDVVRSIEFCLTESRFQGGTWDIASHDPMTYRDMILRSAKVLGLRPRTIDFPANFIGLSKLWVSLISQSSPSLVNPLLASLRHAMLAKDNALLVELMKEAVPFEQSVKDSVDENGRPVDLAAPGHRRRKRRRLRKARRVRSVQRMPLPPGWDAPRVADEYGRWLTRTSFTIINVQKLEDGTLRFVWRWPEVSMLELHPSDLTRHQQGRRVFYIRGGLLTRSREEPPGRFEFRVVEEGRAIIAAIHEYAPRLPWFIYQFTQAKVHLLVMRAFAAHLRRERAAGNPFIERK
tara:strand:+ start:5827 stop:7260 length:1434 start_codon:yes stop_codon:yes gene_type:complete